MSLKIQVNNTRHGNPGVSGWYAILPEPEPARVLEEDLTADWLVIGGGFAGLSAARRLQQLRKNERIVLLDSIRIGEGSSGRNSGFMIDLPHDISTDSYAGAVEGDIRQTQKNRYAISFAAEAAEEYGFSQEVFNPCGKINAAASEKGDQHNREYIEHLKAMGEESTWLAAADMKRITGTEYYLSGLLTPKTITIQAAAYVRGFAGGLSRNVDIYENSPVVAMERTDGLWKVRTPKGSVSASKVILSVNGHLQSFGFLKRRLMHIFLYASMTRALTEEEIRKLGGEPSWGVAPANPFGSSVRKISGVGGHRILMRNKFHFTPLLEASDRDIQRAVRDHDRSFQRRFPMLKDVEMEYRWGGRLCLSWNGVPVFGELEDGLFAACCQNGLGASKGTLAGILAAEYASRVQNSYIEDYLNEEQPTRLPPEPFATIGATAFLNWQEWRAGLEK